LSILGGHSPPNFVMKLTDYFENAKGIGVLATAAANGAVNAAIYARPYFLDPADDSTIAFIMGDRKSHDNVSVNPSALYLFIEEGTNDQGIRLTLTKTREENDQEKIRAICRRKSTREENEEKVRFLVHFRIDAVRPLTGTGE
jgi:hypothetical protein